MKEEPVWPHAPVQQNDWDPLPAALSWLRTQRVRPYPAQAVFRRRITAERRLGNDPRGSGRGVEYCV